MPAGNVHGQPQVALDQLAAPAGQVLEGFPGPVTQPRLVLLDACQDLADGQRFNIRMLCFFKQCIERVSESRHKRLFFVLAKQGEAVCVPEIVTNDRSRFLVVQRTRIC